MNGAWTTEVGPAVAAWPFDVDRDATAPDSDVGDSTKPMAFHSDNRGYLPIEVEGSGHAAKVPIAFLADRPDEDDVAGRNDATPGEKTGQGDHRRQGHSVVSNARSNNPASVDPGKMWNIWAEDRVEMGSHDERAVALPARDPRDDVAGLIEVDEPARVVTSQQIAERQGAPVLCSRRCRDTADSERVLNHIRSEETRLSSESGGRILTKRHGSQPRG